MEAHKDEYFQLRGKVVLITGASSGIGARTAVEFAKLGSKVALTGRDHARLNETAAECRKAGLSDHEIYIVTGDICKEGDLKRIADETISTFGTVHVLVNCAGRGQQGSMMQCTRETLKDMFDIHVLAPFTLTQLVVPHLLQNKGAVINVSTVTRPFLPGSATCVAKAAENQMTQLYALELAAKGVRVCSVNPGAIKTPMLERLAGPGASQKLMDGIATMHPMGRVGESREVAQSIVFLASNAASFITGVNMNVCGGLALTMQQPWDGWPVGPKES